MNKDDTEKLLKNQRDTAKAAVQQAGGRSWGVRASFEFLAGFLVTLLVVLVYLIRGYKMVSAADQVEISSCKRWEPVFNNDTRKSSPLLSSSDRGCDLFSGKWVYDNESQPLYRERQCSFMSDHVACERNGRKDLRFQNWRWQPHQCDLPRFNGTALLERLRNKRFVYVGDSLNRGQWESMVCLLDTAISSPSSKSLTYPLNNSSLFVFKAIEYNATIEFYWAPLMVESNSDDPLHHTALAERIVRVNSIEKHARHWNDADILVFDSYLWWRLPTIKVLWGSFGSKEGVYKEMEMLRSYEMALQTWSDWLEVHLNRSKTQIFWVTMSPSHDRGEDWGGAPGSNCYNETELITKEDYWGSGSYPEMFRAVERAVDKLGQMGLKVQLLNITQLSEYRKEAHVSAYMKPKPKTKAQLSGPIINSDCFHWCLPGVPDTWNQLLYAYILTS